ncbi:MAG: MFS transporter [Acidimicrobiia bacterium]|nr:MAG: MFS transporter [Acidimicrobiia bacterium]
MNAVEPVGNPSDQVQLKAKRNLIPLVGGQAVSLFGDYIAFFTLPLFVLSLTGDPFDLGLTAAAETLPMLLFGLAAGVFLDRRRRLGATLVGVDIVRAGAFLFLAVGSYGGWIDERIVFGVAFLAGSMAVLFDSGLQSYMTRSLLDEDLMRANAQLGIARTLALSAAPLVAGIIVTLAGGFALAFGLNAATFIVSAALLSFVRPIKAAITPKREPFMEAVGSGLRVLFADRRLKWGTLGGTVSNLVFQPLEALLVLFVATEVLGLDISLGSAVSQGGREIAIFFAAQAAIGSVGVAFAGRIAKRIPLGTMYIVGLVMLGSGFLTVALIGNWFAVIPAGIAIAGVTWVNVALVTMRQQLAPPEHMGRVIAASRTLAWAGLPVGAAVGGALAGAVGVVPVYIAGSAGVIVVSLLLMRTALFRDPVMAGR